MYQANIVDVLNIGYYRLCCPLCCGYKLLDYRLIEELLNTILIVHNLN